MKTLKKLSVILLTLVMMSNVFPIFSLTEPLKAEAVSDSDFFYDIIDKDSKKCWLTGYTGKAEKVIIPETIDGYTVAGIRLNTFSDLFYIKSISLPSGLEYIEEGSFFRCNGLTSITADSRNTHFSSSDGVLFNKDKTVLIKYPNKKTNKSYTVPNTVETIGFGAFESTSFLTSVTVPNSVKKIDTAAFASTVNIEDNSSVKAIKNIKLGNGVQYIGVGAFLACAITSITLPESLEIIDEAAFLGCPNLTTINIPVNVQTIERGAFSSCSSLNDIKVSSKNNYYISVGGVLFNKDKTELCCYPNGKNKTSYTIPYGVQIIGANSFFNCTALKSISIPLSVKELGYCAFQGCKNISSITLPESVQYIGDWAFSDCSSLTSIIIPGSVQILGYQIFSQSPSVTIYGIKNSSAEKYAVKYNIPFKAYKIESGDVNGDGKITLNDAMLIINDVAKKAPLHELFKTRADVDADKNITLNDAMYIINFVAKKSDTVFPQK